MTPHALWAVAPGECALRPVVLPAAGPSQVRVRSVVGAISRGTERLVVHGRVPASEHQRMRGPHMEGSFSFPVKYGYVSVGRVASGALPPGTAVFCLHPHQSEYVVSVDAVMPLPASTPLDRAVLAPNLETAINIIWDSGASVGDRVAVVGGGVVGCLVAWLAGQIPGTEVTIVDPADRSREAEALGVAWAPNADLLEDHDVVVHASGHPAGAVTALSIAGNEAVVVEASWFGDHPVSLPLGRAFHSRRLTLRSSQVGQLPPSRKARWTYRRRMERALALAAAPALDILFTEDIPFRALPTRLPQVTAAGAPGMCYRVRYPAP